MVAFTKNFSSGELEKGASLAAYLPAKKEGSAEVAINQDDTS